MSILQTIIPIQRKNNAMTNKIQIQVRDFAVDYFNMDPERVTLLAQSGSDRVYVRIFFPGFTIIGTHGLNIPENKAFIYLAGHFRSRGLPVPEVLAINPECTIYLQTDNGHTTLFDVIYQSEGSQKTNLLEPVVDHLTQFQTVGTQGLDFLRCFPEATFGFSGILADLDYFESQFLGHVGVAFDRQHLRKEMSELALEADGCNFQTFMYRDFQSRNIMLHEGRYCFIDFQGGRRGPGVYDIISLLFQARLQLDADSIEQLSNYYFEKISVLTTHNLNQLKKDFELIKIIRFLQVLGAYGLRGIQQGKSHFLESINPAIDNLSGLLDNAQSPIHQYPELSKTLLKLIQLKNKGKVWQQVS